MQNYILVTGASGFVGASLCQSLLAQGHKVLGIGRKDAYNTNLHPKERGFLSPETLNHHNFKYERLELKNLDDSMLRKYEFSLAFHLASMVEYASLEYTEYTEYTITPTLKLIDFALQAKIPKIIFTSTASVYAPPPALSLAPYSINESSPISPSSYYGLAKYTCEKLLEIATFKHKTLNVATLRFPALFGLNHLGGVIYEFAKSAWENSNIELFSNGEVLRNVLYIDYAIQALLLAARVEIKGYECFCIGSANSQSTAFIASTLIDALHSRSKLMLSPKPSPNPFNAQFDLTKAKAQLGFEPPSIESTLKSYAKAIFIQGGLV